MMVKETFMEMAFKPKQTWLNAAWVNKTPQPLLKNSGQFFKLLFFHFYFDTAEDEPNINLLSYKRDRKGHVYEFFRFPFQVLNLRVTAEISVFRSVVHKR